MIQVRHDPEADALFVRLAEGWIVAMEFLKASERVAPTAFSAAA